jgi:lipopolysaccharide biosynthesis regulator YciM
VALRKRRLSVDVRQAGSVEAAWRRSLRAAVASDWPTAETWLERIVEADSTDLDAYHALARLYREQGAIGRAIRMHQNLLMRGDLPRSERDDALLELARNFDDGGFSARAAGSYEEVLDSQPRNTEALRRLVSLLHESREFPRAISLIKRLRRLDRAAADSAEVELLLSQAQSQLDEGDHDGARGTLKRCLRRYKACGSAWAMLGQIEVERGKNARALDAWRKGALADPEMAPTLYPKIEAGFSARGKSQDYEKFLNGILADRPGDHAARIALSRTLVSRGEASIAIEELSRAIEVAPDHAGLRVELGRLLLADGHEAEALKAYAGLLEALERGGGVSATPGTVATGSTRDSSRGQGG